MIISLIFIMLKQENVDKLICYYKNKLNIFSGVGICKANSSYITHVDWDIKGLFRLISFILILCNYLGKVIMTNSGAREHLFYEAPRGTRITSIKTTDVEKMKWFTWTGVIGLTVEGIWEPATDITDVNATHLSKDEKILATADDFGLVKLFDYPVRVITKNKIWLQKISCLIV